MKNYFIVLAALLIVVPVVHGESSLSARGYGWQNEASSVRAQGMGLAGIAASDSLSLDLFTPANWAGPRTTRFGFGTWVGHTTASDATGSDASDNGGISGVGFVVHAGKGIFAGVTLAPYTSLDYKWRDSGSVPFSSTTTRRQGNGGLTQALIGGSLPIGSEFRVGLAARPVFGKLQRLWALDFADAATVNASETISDRFLGWGYALSGHWTDGINSAAIALQPALKAQVEHQKVVGAGSSAQEDSTYDLPTKYGLPTDVTFGFGTLYKSHHLFSVEGAWHGWGSVNDTLPGVSKLTDGVRLSAGWEYTPEYRPLDPAWRALVYRAGVYTDGSYALSEKGHQIRRTAITAGLGIPYADNKSRLDLAVEYGWSGDLARDGARERSFNVTIGFNHSQMWFVGRKERER